MKPPIQIGLTTLLVAGLSIAPARATPITIQKFIPVPTSAANVQPGGAFTFFDISYIDPVTGNDYVADRSNASVDIFSGTSLTFLGRASGFTGQQATTSCPRCSRSVRIITFVRAMDDLKTRDRRE